MRNQDTGNDDDQAMVENAAEKGQLFSVRALNSNFPYDPSDTVLAYAESFAIVNFIIDTYGDEKFAALIAAYRTGVSHDDAMRAALGFDLDELDRLWKESLDYPGDQPRSAGNRRFGFPLGSNRRSGTRFRRSCLVCRSDCRCGVPCVVSSATSRITGTHGLAPSSVVAVTMTTNARRGPRARLAVAYLSGLTTVNVAAEARHEMETARRRASILDPAAIERKLALDTFNVDRSRAHIRIIDRDVCLRCVREQCINRCRATCYTPRKTGVLFSYEGCVECGTCWIVCHEFDNIEWTYPRGGFGIQYRHG